MIDRSVVENFFKANGALATLCVAVLGLGDDVRTEVGKHPYGVTIALVASQIAVAAILWALYRQKGARTKAPTIDPSQRFSLKVRFANPEDHLATSAVYREWFKPGLAINVDEWRDLMRPEKRSMRVFELTSTTSLGSERRIVGYYALWPMRHETFERLVSGELKEREVVSSMVLDPRNPEAEALYVADVCVSKTSGAEMHVIRDLMRYVRKILIENEAIRLVGSWPCTEPGIKLAEDFSMTSRSPVKARQKIHETPRASALTLPSPSGVFKESWSFRY